MRDLERVRLKARAWVWPSLILVLLVLLALDLLFGAVPIPLGAVLKALWGFTVPENNWGLIVRDYRLPKALTAVLSGASLSVAGLQMQTLFRNPLADPYILGISSGANLGAALVILVTADSGVHFLAKLNAWGELGVIIAASAGAFFVFLIVLILARKMHTTTLLIAGVLVGYVINAFVRVLIQYAMPESVQAYLSWTFGSFSGVAWKQLLILAPVLIISLLMSLLTIKPLNALLLGELHARSVGIDPRKARWLIVINASILTGAVTAFCGTVGFIGIAVPHLSRSLLGNSDHRVVIPASILLGGSIALIADLLSQGLGGAFLLPVNSVTALVGGPVILFVILKKRNLSRVFDA